MTHMDDHLSIYNLSEAEEDEASDKSIIQKLTFIRKKDKIPPLPSLSQKRNSLEKFVLSFGVKCRQS